VSGGNSRRRDFADALDFKAWRKEHGAALEARPDELHACKDRRYMFEMFGKRILAVGEKMTGAQLLELLKTVGRSNYTNFLIERYNAPPIEQIARDNPDVALLPLVRAYLAEAAEGRQPF
jgi:hypothetical protein